MCSENKMSLHDYYYDLPEELIAQDPLEDRSSSRLMVLDKNTGEIEHHIFKEIIDYLNPGDCLVINDTKVLPARLYEGIFESRNRRKNRSSSFKEGKGC